MKIPTKIYHYTRLSTLESILNSRKIRFSNLTKVNDENEGETQDIGNLGKYIFISCWTDNPKENDWMWTEYGDNYQGVRISMDFPPFHVYDKDHLPTIIPPNGVMKENIYILPARENYYDFIEYTSNESDLKPKVVYDSSEIGQLKFGKVGKCKEPGKWSVEEELRFIVYTLPKKLHQGFNDLNSIIVDGIQMMKDNSEIGIEYIDWTIDSGVYKNMVITAGSEMSVEDFSYLEELVDRFNVSTEIIKSDFYRCS